ncbi:MAG: TldD/PmbA family protein [Pseudomonadota bacterium]|nr:TldD/PmbA family protein [Pseudomonadota bacterium]
MTDTAANLLEDLVRKAKGAGADAADAMLVDATSLSVNYRLGKVETLERSESGDLGLRVFVGKRQAMVSATDRKPKALEELVERAVAMAREAPEDTFCGLAEAKDIAKNYPQLDMADDGHVEASALIAQARQAEEAGLAIAGVTNSEGASAGGVTAQSTIVASNGFAGHNRRTSYNLSMTALAGDGTAMERDYDYATRVAAADMPDAASIGARAGQRAVRRLGSRKMATGRMPVVFEQRIAGGLLGHLASAVSGASVARGTSFLKDKLGQAVFPETITIVDDPLRPRGLRSRPFDAEGMLTQRRHLIEKGVLTTWLLDLRSGRQLKMKSTGHASRQPGGAPSPSVSNLYMEPGTVGLADLIRDIREGFYVTDMMGMGVNAVTGDYSQAASGYWIENGVISFPVSEMTIAGNLKDMFRNLLPANDVEFRYGIDAPTLRIEGMMVAGV